jgi:hypothetical protein
MHLSNHPERKESSLYQLTSLPENIPSLNNNNNNNNKNNNNKERKKKLKKKRGNRKK